MKTQPHPFLWLLSGFLSCGVLLTGILWWRGGGNPFLKSANPPPPLVAAPSVSPAAPELPAPAVPAPAEPAGPAADSAPSTAAAPPPPASDTAPAAAVPPLAEAVKQAIAVTDPSALTTLAALAKAGTVPQDQLTDAAYQWGSTHLPADLSNPDAPFEEVLKLLKNAATPEERGLAAVALAGSGRSTEALDAIRKTSEALAADAPERFLVEEALKLATSVPDEADPGSDVAAMKATAPMAKPTALKTPAPPAPAETNTRAKPTSAAAPPPPAPPKKDEGTGEAVQRPVLPHETPDDAAKLARMLKEAAAQTEPAVPSLTSPPPPVSVVPMPAAGGPRQTKIQPAN